MHSSTFVPSRFNVRVYGIWLQEEKVLVNEEFIFGQKIIKFPGGGLELGEGLIEGLKREWKEELDLQIEVLNHFYTTDFFQKSAFDDSQVISVYYLVNADASLPLINKLKAERSFWVSLKDLHTNSFTLPIEKVVLKKLLSRS